LGALADRTWLDAAPTRRLVAILDAAGIDFRFVGGAVRDGLLGRPVADIDLATPATPEMVVAALAAAGCKSIPTGIAHGTVTALVDGRPFEITTLRRDVETDGRHAIVAFTDDWRIDAARRDFTINALYADSRGEILDLFGGAADARAGRVRFIGDPRARIREDALRILRFFRFHARFGSGAPDPAGLAACAELAGMIDGLSAERIRVEVLKLLAAPAPQEAWTAMIESGVMAHVVEDATRIGDLAALVALEARLDLAPDPVRRLAALIGSMTPSRIADLKSRLKLSNRDADQLAGLDAPGRVALVEARAFGRALYRAEPAWVRDAALLAHIRLGAPSVAALVEFIAFIPGWSEPSFPLGGEDLIAMGISPGPRMGNLLSAVESWWRALDFAPDRRACLAELARRMG
jgi:poly(A) polymerase